MYSILNYPIIRRITHCNLEEHWANEEIGRVIFCKPHKMNYESSYQYDLKCFWYEGDEIDGGLLVKEWTEPYPCKLIEILYGVSEC